MVADETVLWHVYVLRSGDRARTYVGITLDLERRLAQHNGEKPGGARATRAHRPWSVGATFGPYETRSEATKVELAVKRLRGAKRLAWAPAPGPATRAPQAATTPALREG